MNQLVSILASCDLKDVASLRNLYVNGNVYHYYGCELLCEETQRTTPENVKFILKVPVEILGLEVCGNDDAVIAADFCLREFAKRIDSISLKKYSDTGREIYTGAIYIQKPGPEVLIRNTAFISGGYLELVFYIKMPILMKERHKVVSGRTACKIVRKDLGRAIRDFIDNFDRSGYVKSATLFRRQQEIRRYLLENGYISFIANGSILPRDNENGPLSEAVPFQSPVEEEREILCEDGFKIKGMVIREGVTVITGGGYSGKSTLLDSMLLGIYNHVAGDGREFCITRENCCKIMNEEGRAISNLDISAFLKNSKLLNTESFSTLDASGSTSQAANIMEAISFGVNALFIDEDRTATNFMIRDRRMRQLIKNDPIVPFTDRVKELYEQLKISTVLVIGGSSEYLDIADYVYIMEDYCIKNITSMVQENLQNCISDSSGCDLARYRLKRYLKVEAMCTYIYDSENRRFREELAIRKRKIIIGNFSFDVSKLSTILSEGQVAAIAFIIRLIVTEVQAGTVDICEKVDEIYERIVENGLSFVYTNKFEFWPELELPNKLDVMFAMSRLRVRNDGSESGEEKLALRKQT